MITEAMDKDDLRQSRGGRLFIGRIRAEKVEDEMPITFQVLVYKAVPSGHVCVPSSAGGIDIALILVTYGRDRSSNYLASRQKILFQCFISMVRGVHLAKGWGQDEDLM